MRTFDLTPFYRSTVGFDRLFSMLDQTGVEGAPGRVDRGSVGCRDAVGHTMERAEIG